MRSMRVRSLLSGLLAVLFAIATVPAAEAVVTPTVTRVGPVTGSPDGGTVVTISGKGFATASQVLFRRAGFASFRVDSDTVITASAPPGAGTVDVIVFARHFAAHSKVTPADRFTYLPPVVTSVSPRSGGLAGGNTITIRGTGLRDAEQIAIGGARLSTFKINADGSINVVVPRTQLPQTTNVGILTNNSYSDATPGSRYTYVAEISTLKVTGVSPATGSVAGGQTVTITGAGFTDVSRVEFLAGGDDRSATARSYTVNSSTSITAVMPGSYGHGTLDAIVYVRNNSAHSAVSASDVYTYIRPTITRLSATSGSITAGNNGTDNEVTITGTGFTDVTSVSLGEFGDTADYTVNSPTSITVNVSASQEPLTIDISVAVGNLSSGSAITPADAFTYVE